MWLTDQEQIDLLESTGPITSKITKAVQVAIQALGLATASDVDRVWKTAQKIDKRQVTIAAAELRAKAAYASTYKSNVEDKDD
jgi:hypothetical protein